MSRFEAITGVRAALRRLPGRGLVRATGADRVRFLNGMLTADVAKLPAGGVAWFESLRPQQAAVPSSSSPQVCASPPVTLRKTRSRSDSGTLT